jgi:TRAP-type C4-dicarboxylate transport system permease small subunit
VEGLVLRKLSDGINRIVVSIAWLLMGLEIIAVFIQIVIRLTRIQFVGISEIVSMLFIWITFIGSTIALKEGLHISITTLVNFLPAKIKRVCFVLSYIACFTFSLILVIKGFETFKVAMLQTSSGLKISIGWFYGVIPISGIIMAVHSGELFLQNLTDLKKLHDVTTKRGNAS